MAAATDGHQLFACTFPAEWQDGQQSATFDLIIPYDVAKEAGKATKRGPQDIVLASTDSGLYMLGDRVFAPIDGRFPDIARVIPQPYSMGDEEGPGQFAPDVIGAPIKAINTWHGHNCAFVHHRGTSQSAVISGADASAVGIAMPMRQLGEYTGFTVVPEKTSEQTKADLDALEARQC